MILTAATAQPSTETFTELMDHVAQGFEALGAAILAGLARSNLLLVPLDRRDHWYRYHHLFRDMLLAELARIELTRVHLALTDIAGARTLMREIDELLERRPDLGTLVGQARALRAQLSADLASSIPGPSCLTGAELRVLPMLTTHLSLPEIGAELFLSPHTVKSQAISIYRKLGTCSRSQAVTRSRELGLLDG